MYNKTKELRATISMPKLAIFWTSLVPFRDAIRTRHKLHILCISAPIPLHQCSDVRQERLKSRKLALPKPDNPAHQLSKRRSRRRLKIASAIGRMQAELTDAKTSVSEKFPQSPQHACRNDDANQSHPDVVHHE